MRRGRGKVEKTTLIWAAFSVSSSISGQHGEESDEKHVEKTLCVIKLELHREPETPENVT